MAGKIVMFNFSIFSRWTEEEKFPYSLLQGKEEEELVILCANQNTGDRYGCSFILVALMIVIVVVIISVFLSSCGYHPRRNVILIGVDTVRADHLGCYGYYRNTTPAIDKLAKMGTRFDRCFSPIPRTTQTLCSVLTGRYPISHGVRFLYDKLPESELTIAEILKEYGYKTVSVVGTGVTYQMADDGFDVVIDTEEELTAAEVTDKAIGALEDISQPFFLWTFYRDPHFQYTPPHLYFNQDYDGKRFKSALYYYAPKGEMVYKNTMNADERVQGIALYDSEIKYMDAEIGRLIDILNEKYENNIIVFYSDHGEGLGENNYYYDHGDLLNQASLRVPLIITGIDFKESNYNGVVRLIDIAPTIFSALGVKKLGVEFDGTNLIEVVREKKKDLPAFSETGKVLLQEAYELGYRDRPGLQGRLRSLVLGEYKIVYFPKKDGPVYNVYNLIADPSEQTDITERMDPEIFQKLKLSLDRMIERDPLTKLRDRPLKAEKDRLRALGYL